ncbi:MAG: bh protein [Candidatus Caldatribacteriaceae bacterium]
MKTTLTCLRCQKDTPHRVLYQVNMIRAIRCEECGLEVSFDQAKLLTLYGEELLKRVLTKPRRLAEEYKKDLFTFFSSIPFRIVTKPYRILKELESLQDD